MAKTENSPSRIKAVAFIDYKPAELKQNKDWIIVYYAKNPVNGKLERFRLRVPTMQSKSERLKFGKRIVVEINEKLLNGWSPYLEESGKNYRSFEAAVTDFQTRLDKMIADNVLRPDTKRTYDSNCRLLSEFVKSKQQITFALEINRRFCLNYLDWIYIDRNSSPRTRNNQLVFIKLFCTFLVDRGILAENPAVGISPLKNPEKKRVIFSEAIKKKVSRYWDTLDTGFPVMGKTIYFCLIRNSELAKLRVADVNIQTGTIFVAKGISKNKKDENVTIPDNFLPILEKHIKNAQPDWYLFSNDNFFPGEKIQAKNKILNTWNKLRKELNLESEYQFYGLKDTGITDLLNSGVPAIKVRDQARHSDIKITEMYTRRNNFRDETIKNANFNI